eukprot:2700793-Karenia_brevis.AAC.1
MAPPIGQLRGPASGPRPRSRKRVALLAILARGLHGQKGMPPARHASVRFYGPVLLALHSPLCGFEVAAH